MGRAQTARFSVAVGVALVAIVAGAHATRAASGASVSCTDTAADQTLLQNAIDGGGTVSVRGHCLGNWQIGNRVTLTGVGEAILDGRHVARVVTVQSGVTATVNALTVENGAASFDDYESGGGIAALDGSTLNVKGSTITGNSAWSGGGIGGGISATVNVTGTTISGNYAGDGGGIDVAIASLVVTNSSIAHNTAFLGGGGIAGLGSTIAVSDVHISWNTAALQGGGLSSDNGQVTLTDTTVEHNTGQGAGGILNLSFQVDSRLSLNSSNVAFNRDVGGMGFGYGGGGVSNIVDYIACADCTARLDATDSKIYGNVAPASGGGGIYNASQGFNSAVVFLRNTTVSSGSGSLNPNTARYGGGIYNAGWALPPDGIGGVVTLLPGAAVVHNAASVDGGGIYNTLGGTVARAGGVVMLNSPDDCVGC